MTVTVRARLAGAVIAVFLVAAGLAGAPSAAARGERPGTGSLDTAVLQAQLDALVAAGYVGAVAEVVGPTGTWRSAAGTRRVDRPTPARAGDRTRVASVTKMMVASLVLQEVQRGRWTLDTSVGAVLPGLLPGHDAVTVRQLLSHTSGAPDYLGVLFAEFPDLPSFEAALSTPRTDAELVAMARSVPWAFEPGTRWGYSNTNYVVLGMMLAAATGWSVRDLLRWRVFLPAGMWSSSFPRTPAIPGANLVEYALFEGAPPLSLARFEPSIFSSAGAVVSTVSDLDRFQRAWSSGWLFSPDLVAAARVPVPENDLGYGLGTYPLPDVCPGADGSPQLVYGHDGASFGTFTLSFSSGSGDRRVAISWTGRGYPQSNYQPAIELMYTMLDQSCPTPPSARSAPGERPAAVRLPALEAWNALVAGLPASSPLR